MFENSSISAYQPTLNYPSKHTENISSYQQHNRIAEKESFNLSTDKVTLSYSSESVMIYDSSMTLRGNRGDGFDLLRGLVLNMFKEQGIDSKIATGDTNFDINTITPAEAQDLVADDGYFGVDKTSQRIFDLAVGIAGGDPTKIDAIRAGVEKGFQEAKKALGDWLPDISYATYDAVMQKLDDWAGFDNSLKSTN